MSALKTPADLKARREALDTGRSFIVQAPAGSGKTGLLTQRYLALLAGVEHPEEIVAITFTRKAAAEMRQRILDALQGAEAAEPREDYERQTWQLARAALAQDKRQGWGVQDNPQRLRIRTIDSLCQFISRQSPVRSGFGEVPGTVDDASFLYRAAAEQTLGELESSSEVADALATLLHALDNQVDKLAGLIAAMLARRDQWGGHVVNHGNRAETEQVLVGVIERHLAELSDVLGQEHARRIPPLLRFAAGNLDDDHPLAMFRECRLLPDTGADALPSWQVLAQLFLTTTATWRKNVNKGQGFPADKKSPFVEMKAEVGALLEDLREREDLRSSLAALASLPNPGYSDEEWAVVEALFVVLKHAVGELRVVFAEQGQVDFTELSLSAIDALGDELAPTELALQLDYRLKHLLVDEFQDTSQTQNRLFEQLTTGWQQGDGRTLFLVGDPMQSIYRFREADVGQFLDAWEGRLGHVELEPLQLTVNFRSDQGVIQWVNNAFPGVLPGTDDKERGAVRYARSEPYKEPGLNPAVQVHPFLDRDDAAEAEKILELIGTAGVGTTAVLARSKAHLAELVTQLRCSGLRFQAVEIGALQHSPAVLDLVSLTRALIHSGDRVAWLALLYGPYCGLSLEDLLALTGEEPAAHVVAVASVVLDRERYAHLSDDGRARLGRVAPILRQVLGERGRRPLHDWVESAWLALGGPLTLVDASAREDVEVYFQLLQRLESDSRPVTPERLVEEVERLTAMPDPEADGRLQLMSIHKAKGLEFDTVILPGLGKGTRTDDPQLLYWLQTTGAEGEAELFFGPVRMSREKSHSTTTEYIKQLEKEKGDYESGRLLYVAATRAKRALHLLGHAKEKASGEVEPASGSLLRLLWPSVGAHWKGLQSLTGQDGDAEDGTPHGVVDIRRSAVPIDWVLPEPPPGIQARPAEPDSLVGDIPFEWAGETARAVGTVVHRLLQHFVESKNSVTTPGFDADPELRMRTERLLLQNGVTPDELADAMGRVESAFRQVDSDAKGRWVLSAEHAESACERPLTAVIDGQIRHLIIDRTFVDADGARWVIDYKTGMHTGGGLKNFLDEEEKRYREQLEAYVGAFRKLEDRPVRAALYFPLIEGGWRELDV